VDELGGDLPLNLSVDVIGDAMARLGDALKPGCHVHAVAKDVIAFNEHIARIDSKPKPTQTTRARADSHAIQKRGRLATAFL
jgi:hypothetical protein